MTARREAIEGRMRRRLGMSPDTAARLFAHNAQQSNWHGQCRVCRTTFTGSIAAAQRPCPVCGHGEENGQTGS